MEDEGNGSPFGLQGSPEINASSCVVTVCTLWDWKDVTMMKIHFPSSLPPHPPGLALISKDTMMIAAMLLILCI